MTDTDTDTDTDLGCFHVDSIKYGEFDPYAGDETLSAVFHDSTIHYYDLSKIHASASDFAWFVAESWDLDVKPVCETLSENVYHIDLDFADIDAEPIDAVPFE